VQITNFPDSVAQPALSPDGRMLAFIRGPNTFVTSGQIYVKVLPDGEPVQLTRDDTEKMSPVFSPDASRIAYTVLARPQWGDTWIGSVINGQPRLWLVGASGLSWTASNRVLFSEIKDANIHMAIVTSEENRAGAREIYRPASSRGMAHRSYPSPDGNWVLIVEMDADRWLPCRLVPMHGSTASRQVGPPDAPCTYAGWSPDGKWMFLNSSTGGAYHLWRQRFPDGKPEQITSGVTEEEGIALAPDGRSVITAVGQRQSVVWLHDPSGERQISLEGFSYDPKFTPDGRRLIYRILKGSVPLSDPSELRIVDLESGQSDSLMPGVAVHGYPGRTYDLSHDGRWVIAEAADREGKHRLWLAAIDRQSPPRQIPNAEGGQPLFEPTGDILFSSTEGVIRRIDREGNVRGSAGAFTGLIGVSRDGNWVVGVPPVEEVRRMVTALSLRDGTRVPIIPVNSHHFAWSGNTLFLSITTSPSLNSLTGKTYVIPLMPGQAFPEIPPGGLPSDAEIATLPGATAIDAYDVSPGPTPGMYAYSRQTVHRNLYRIPLQ